MKKSLRIALAVVILASLAPIALAASAPTNPWPTPVPNSITSDVSAPTNPWPTPVPQSLSSLFSMFLSFFGL
jgi:hypothetical protein